MKTFNITIGLAAIMTCGLLENCASGPNLAPDVSASLRSSFDAAGLKDVSVKQDREKGIVTLGGHVPSEADKAQAETLTKNIAASQVVANQIAVLPPGAEDEAKKVNSALDAGIESNLEAAFIKAKLKDGVKYSAKNGVVTITGDLSSQALRSRAQAVAAAVPNVSQVVNEIQVKGQKATSTR